VAGAVAARTAIYWMPLDYKQTDPINVTSLMYEDLFMLRLRVERLNGARTFSQKPKSRCHHVIQRPFVDVMDEEANRYRDQHLHALCRDAAGRAVPAGADRARMNWRWSTDAIRIANKRVDLLNCDAAFGNIQLLP
jgi:3-phenylpropionate/cinnamic acid dioxygenase small subunit